MRWDWLAREKATLVSASCFSKAAGLLKLDALSEARFLSDRTERWMVVLAVTWMAKIGRESEVAAIFEKLTAESRREPGCVMYQVHKHKTDPRRFFIYEQYRDDAAIETHRNTPHFLQHAKKELPKIADRVEG